MKALKDAIRADAYDDMDVENLSHICIINLLHCECMPDADIPIQCAMIYTLLIICLYHYLFSRMAWSLNWIIWFCEKEDSVWRYIRMSYQNIYQAHAVMMRR